MGALIFLLLVQSASAAEIGFSFANRSGDYDLWFRHESVEVEFIDLGKQPNGIPNRNRPLNLDYIHSIDLGHSFSVFGKVGLTRSRFSYNGSGNGYKNRTGFTGNNFGIGVEWGRGNWGVRAQWIAMRYPQSDIPKDEHYYFGSAGVFYRF